MSLTELVPVVQALPRADRLRLVQMLVGDLAREESAALVEADAAYPVWTPYHSYNAAAVLLQALENEKATA